MESSPNTSTNLRTKLLAGGGLTVVAVAVGLAWWLGFLTPEPEPVSISDAVATVASESSAETDPVETTSPSNPANAAGVEVEAEVEAETVAEPAGESINSIVGEWAVIESDATFIGYRADGNTGESVGRSPGVTGTLTATDDQITAVNVVGDMTMLTSDSSVRDDHLGDEGLETNVHTTSTFVLTEPISISEIPAAGVETTFSAVGDLTVKEITRSVTIALQAVVIDDKFVVTGSTDIALEDFQATIGNTTEATMEFSLVFSQ